MAARGRRRNTERWPTLLRWEANPDSRRLFVFGGNFMNNDGATDIKADVKIDTPTTNN